MTKKMVYSMSPPEREREKSLGCAMREERGNLIHGRFCIVKVGGEVGRKVGGEGGKMGEECFFGGEGGEFFVLFCFVLFCFVLFCFVLFCFVLFCFFVLF